MRKAKQRKTLSEDDQMLLVGLRMAEVLGDPELIEGLEASCVAFGLIKPKPRSHIPFTDADVRIARAMGIKLE